MSRRSRTIHIRQRIESVFYYWDRGDGSWARLQKVIKCKRELEVCVRYFQLKKNRKTSIRRGSGKKLSNAKTVALIWNCRGKKTLDVREKDTLKSHYYHKVKADTGGKK